MTITTSSSKFWFEASGPDGQSGQPIGRAGRVHGTCRAATSQSNHRAVVVTAFSIVDELLYGVTYQSYRAIGADRLDGDFDDQPLVGFRQQVAVHCLAPCYSHFDKTAVSDLMR